jgi:hypothetical protein
VQYPRRRALRLAVGLALLVGCGDEAPLAADPDGGVAAPAPPARLSETGLFASGASGPYADGVRTYGIRYPLWTDGAVKRRHLLLPDGGRIDTSDPDGWRFPEGTRIFKEFEVDGALVETRLLWKAGPDVEDWVYVSYRADGEDGVPVPEGEDDVLGTAHDVPSTADCRNCHRGGADFALGLSAIQLDGATFDAWIADGVLPPDTVYAEIPGDPLERDVLGYLHGNCGHCHNDVHPLAERRALRLHVTSETARPEDAPVRATALGAPTNHDFDGRRFAIVPGSPDDSQLLYRMRLRDDRAMPPVGTEVVDADAVARVERWIAERTLP